MIRNALVKWWRPIRGIFCVARDIDDSSANKKVMFLSKLFKRKSTKLVALLGAFSMMLGVGAVITTNATFSEAQNPVETSANTGGGTLYLDSTSFGTTSGIYAYFYGGSGSGAAGWPGNAMTKLNSTNVFSVTVPAGYNNVIFNNNGSVRSSADNASKPLVIPSDLSTTNIWIPSTNTSTWSDVEGNSSAGQWGYCVPAGYKFYFVPSNKWIADGGTFYFNPGIHGSYSTKQLMTRANAFANGGVAQRTYSGSPSTQSLYCVTTNKPITHFQILCFSGSTQKYYSGSIGPNPSYNTLIIPMNCSWENTMVPGDGSGTYWANLDLRIEAGNQSKSDDTARLFLYNTGSKWGGTGNGICALRAWGGSASPSFNSTYSITASIYELTWIADETGDAYGYCDIPTNVTSFQFVLLEDTAEVPFYNRVIWNYQKNEPFGNSAGFLSNVYYANGNSDKAQVTITTGGAHNDAAGPTLMATLIASINTCSYSTFNGFKAYENLNNYFYSHATDAAKESLCASLGETTTYKVSYHFDLMKKRNDANNAKINSLFALPGLASSNSPLTTTLWIVLGAGLAGLAAIGTAYFVSKKKKYRA